MQDGRLPNLDALQTRNGATGLQISASNNISRTLTSKDEVTEAIAAALGGGETTSAMRVAAVYACVRLLSGTVASLPLALYERSGEQDTIAADHPLTDLIETPNGWQTPHDFMMQAVTHLLMRGNYFAQIVRRGSRIDALHPLNPASVTPKQDDRLVVFYEVRRKDGSHATLPQSDVLHIRALSVDGLVGFGPLEAARRSVDHNARMRDWNSALFAKGVKPSGVLQHPGTLSDPAFERLKSSFDQEYSGTDNAGKPLILEEGLNWQTISLTAEDLQFIDGLKFTRSEIAMFFGVPPHMIGDIERGTSWGSGLEQQNLGFLIYSLKPWLTNIAQAMRRDLISQNDRRRYHFRFDTSDLTRADFKARQEGLRIQRDAGIISANEWRKAEGLNPIESGDSYDRAVGGSAAVSPAGNEGERPV